MVKLYKNFNISKNHKGSIILIGNFDGVHLGHQKLFKLAKSYKKKYNLKIGVINFDPMPKMFFNKSLKNFRLSSINQKLTVMCRQLPPTPHGIPLEVYAFTTDKVWKTHEAISADIFDHILAAASFFHLRLFEYEQQAIG